MSSVKLFQDTVILLKVGGRPGVEMCSCYLQCLVLGWEISAEGTHTLREHLHSAVPDCMCCDQLELQAREVKRKTSISLHHFCEVSKIRWRQELH